MRVWYPGAVTLLTVPDDFRRKHRPVIPTPQVRACLLIVSPFAPVTLYFPWGFVVPHPILFI